VLDVGGDGLAAVGYDTTVCGVQGHVLQVKAIFRAFFRRGIWWWGGGSPEVKHTVEAGEVCRKVLEYNCAVPQDGVCSV